MSFYSITDKAENDLDELAYFVAKDNVVVGLNLYEEAERTFENLVNNPKMGMKYMTINTKLNNIRFFPMKKFSKYFVFYEELNDQIRVIRILHYSRDIKDLI